MINKVESLNAIKKSLNMIGYGENKIIDRYPITTKDNVIYFDFVAFGHDRIHDISTSCISVKYCRDDLEEQKIVDDAVYSASPILLIARPKKVNFWNVSVERKSEKLYELQYDELGEHFAQNRVKYDYSKIVSSKQDIEQINFFNANNLFEFTSKVNCELLGNDFKNALYRARSIIETNSEKKIMDLTSIVMHIIACKILNDKLMLDKYYKDIHEIIRVLARQYSDYFDEKYLYKYGGELVEVIFDSFRKDLSYRSIDNKILGNFYENTLFESDDKKNRNTKKEFGIYYTPSCIVNNMLKFMPVELIDYRRRYVLDASCGSGSLLIGAYKRLKELLPKKMSDEVKHKYLTDMIFGIDIDKFACEVARLELLLTSIPYGNGWKIKTNDFTKLKNVKFKPNIVIANPPYKETRKGEQNEKAAIFLDKYIDLLQDDGIMGIILPQTFLENNSSKKVRKKLLEKINIYELWTLPKGMFNTNNCATVVIIGRKQREINDNPFKVRILNKNSINKFKNTGTFDFDFICKSQKKFLNYEDYRITVSPLESILYKLDQYDKLGKNIDYSQGIQIPYNKSYPFISDEYKDGYSKYYRNAKYGFEKFKIEWEKQKKSKYIKYDTDNKINDEFKKIGLRLRENKRTIIESDKVLVPMNSTPDTFWRIKAAIDRDGIYPSHSLWCIVPKNDNLTLEVIAALLNSKLINFYIGNTNRALTIKKDSILNIPMPRFSQKQKKDLYNYVISIENGYDIEECIEKIDLIVYDAFKLNEIEVKLINEYYSKFNNNFKDENVWCNKTQETIEVTGRVEGVDIDNNKLQISLVESDDIKYIEINDNIPGWLLSEDTSFTCRISEEDFYEDDIEVYNVSPLQYSNLTPEELNNLLISNYNEYDKVSNNKSKKVFKGGA